MIFKKKKYSNRQRVVLNPYPPGDLVKMAFKVFNN
jgi:hypothetical protein